MRESRRVRSLVEDNGQAGDSKICSRRWQSAHFSSVIGVLAPTAVGGYDLLNRP